MNRKKLVPIYLSAVLTTSIATHAEAQPLKGVSVEHATTPNHIYPSTGKSERTIQINQALRQLGVLHKKKSKPTRATPQPLNSCWDPNHDDDDNHCSEAPAYIFEDTSYWEFEDTFGGSPHSIELNVFAHQFPRVELEGPSAGCSIVVNGPFGASKVDCDDFDSLRNEESIRELGRQSRGKAVEEIISIGQEIVGVLTPLSRKCARITSPNAITPDIDASINYFHASNAVWAANPGNASAFVLGTRHDVHYPAGDVIVQYIVTGVETHEGQKIPTLAKYFRGTAGSDTPCK